MNFVACPNCGWGFSSDGFIPFEDWHVKVVTLVGRFMAMQNLKTVGVRVAKQLPYVLSCESGLSPEQGQPADRDPFYSMLKDLTLFEVNEIFVLAPDDRRLLLMRFADLANKMPDMRMFVFPDVIVENYKSKSPILLKNCLPGESH